MRIVVDTNVLISGVFFGGNPRKIVEAIAFGGLNTYATTEIIDEYMGIVETMIERKQGKLNPVILSPLFSAMNVIEGKTEIEICRDPDDDKFIGCAVDAKALYIVSGDKDLLDIQQYDGIQIITAKEFCDKYL